MRRYGQCPPISLPHQTPGPAVCTNTKGLDLSPARSLDFSKRGSCQVSRSTREWNEGFRKYFSQKRFLSVPCALDSNNGSMAKDIANKREILEHIFLLKAKSDLSDDEEKDMLDYLYTSQYQMSGIIAVSLGRLADPNVDGFTHAVFMRFQKKEDLAKFSNNSYYLGVLKEHVIPYCHGWTSVDYVSEVEDDILPIFRRGEEFNYGVEFVLLISVFEDAHVDAVVDALTTLSELIVEFESLIVQATQGSNFNLTDNEFTHGAVIRFPSFEALEIFRGCAEYKNMWWKFQQVTRKVIAVHFTIDPADTHIM